ncbi:MAG TPA: hypothetical protein VN708_26505 [Terriglobales bacterium]|nr:hypothetical protein [Terriglobales bacterium]
MPRYDVSQGMSQKEITEAKERSGKSSNLSQSSRSSSDSSGNGTSVGGANTQPSSGRSGSSTVIATKGFLTEKDLKVSPGKTVTSVVGADVITAVSVKGGNTGLKDVEGNRTETTTDGTRYTVATGETVESGEFPSGRFIVISAGSLKAQTENSITVQFDDNSTRTWQITPTTPVCDEKGQRLGKSELTNGILLAVRWEAQGRQALNLATLGNALSVRRGGLRYKFAEPDGRLVQPTAPVDCACSAR